MGRSKVYSPDPPYANRVGYTPNQSGQRLAATLYS